MCVCDIRVHKIFFLKTMEDTVLYYVYGDLWCVSIRFVCAMILCCIFFNVYIKITFQALSSNCTELTVH